MVGARRGVVRDPSPTASVAGRGAGARSRDGGRVKSRRFAFVVVLAALIAGALAAGHTSSTRRAQCGGRAGRPQPGGARAVGQRVVLPRPPARAAARGRAASPSPTSARSSADVVVTDLPDSGNDEPSHVLGRAALRRDQAPRRARARRRAHRRDVRRSGRGRRGRRGRRPSGSTALRAPRRPSTHWYFGAGTTPRGVQQCLVIDNPYASDAKVDVTLRTSAGVRTARRAPGPRRRAPFACDRRRARSRRASGPCRGRRSTSSVGLGGRGADARVHGRGRDARCRARRRARRAAASDMDVRGRRRPCRGSTPSSPSRTSATTTRRSTCRRPPIAEAGRSRRVSLTVAQDDVAWVHARSLPRTVPTNPCVNDPRGTPVRPRRALRTERLDRRADADAFRRHLRFGRDRHVHGRGRTGAVVGVRAQPSSRASAPRRSRCSIPAAEPSVVDLALVHDGRVERPALAPARLDPARAAR